MKGLTFKCLCGCGVSPVYKFELGNSRGEIEELYNNFIQKVNQNVHTIQDGYDFVKKLLNLPEDKQHRIET